MLGRVDHVKGYHDITRYPDAHLIPGLVLFRWDAPLFFANAEFFHDRVLDAVASSPTPVRWLVVAAEPVTSIDVTAADMVSELDETLHAAGVEMCFAEMKDPVKDKLKRFGLFTRFGEKTFFATARGGGQQLSRDQFGRPGTLTCGRHAMKYLCAAAPLLLLLLSADLPLAAAAELTSRTNLASTTTTSKRAEEACSSHACGRT